LSGPGPSFSKEEKGRKGRKKNNREWLRPNLSTVNGITKIFLLRKKKKKKKMGGWKVTISCPFLSPRTTELHHCKEKKGKEERGRREKKEREERKERLVPRMLPLVDQQMPFARGYAEPFNNPTFHLVYESPPKGKKRRGEKRRKRGKTGKRGRKEGRKQEQGSVPRPMIADCTAGSAWSSSFPWKKKKKKKKRGEGSEKERESRTETAAPTFQYL